MTQQAEKNKQEENKQAFEIVHDSVKEGYFKSRVVRLSHAYDRDVNELYVRIQGSVKFTRVSEDEAPEHFEMDADEVDSFIAAMLQFKDDCKKAKEAKEKHLEEVKALAFKAASKHGLTLTENNDRQSYQDKYELYRDGCYINSTDDEDLMLSYVECAAGIKADTSDLF